MQFILNCHKPALHKYACRSYVNCTRNFVFQYLFTVSKLKWPLEGAIAVFGIHISGNKISWKPYRSKLTKLILTLKYKFQ